MKAFGGAGGVLGERGGGFVRRLLGGSVCHNRRNGVDRDQGVNEVGWGGGAFRDSNERRLYPCFICD